MRSHPEDASAFIFLHRKSIRQKLPLAYIAKGKGGELLMLERPSHGYSLLSQSLIFNEISSRPDLRLLQQVDLHYPNSAVGISPIFASAFLASFGRRTRFMRRSDLVAFEQIKQEFKRKTLGLLGKTGLRLRIWLSGRGSRKRRK